MKHRKHMKIEQTLRTTKHVKNSTKCKTNETKTIETQNTTQCKTNTQQNNQKPL